MEENNLQNNATPNGETPIAADAANPTTPGLGLKGSILKPQTEQDRKSYEKEFEKKANSGTKGPLPIKAILGVLVILLLILAGVSNIGILKKAAKKVVAVKPVTAIAEFKILEKEPVVLGTNFRLRIKTPISVDKTSLLLDGKMTVGTLINEDKSVKNWEFTAQDLKKGDYVFKCYIKDSKANKFTFENGNFTVK